MISQSTLPTATSTASGPVSTQPTVNGGQRSGWDVAIRSGVVSFLQSLYPGYLPPRLQSPAQPADGPAFAMGSGSGQGNGFFQGTELAARLVSAYAALPAEIGNLLGGFVTLSAVGRFAGDQLGPLAAATGSVSGQSQADSTGDGTPTNSKGKKKKTPQPIRQRASSPATAPVQAGPLAKTAVALGALSSLTATGAVPASGSKTEGWIAVPDAKTLGKIGHDPDYPLNGTYRQTADIDGGQLLQPIGNKTHPFTGRLGGQHHTIGNLRHCLVQELAGEGLVDRLCFRDANIESLGPAAVVACEMSDNATVSNIRVENAFVATLGRDADAGIGVGKVNYRRYAVGAVGRVTVANTTAVNCTVTTLGSNANAGIGGGTVSGTVANTIAINTRVSASGSSASAGIAGGSVGPTVAKTTAMNCTVKASGRYSGNAGVGGGVAWGMVADTTAVNTRVFTSGTGGAGIGAGIIHSKGSVANTIAINCKVETSGGRGYAGIGGGEVIGAVINTTAVDSRVSTSGNSAYAGIGAGDVHSKGSVANTIAINCKVETSNFHGDAGIGGGSVGGAVINTTAVDSRVSTSGDLTSAGIGAGYVRREGTVANTIAINCKVEAFGRGSYHAGGAGIGGGYVEGTVSKTTAISSEVFSNSRSGIGGGGSGTVDRGREYSHPPVGFCKHLQLKPIAPNCQPALSRLYGDLPDISVSNGCSANSETVVPPPLAATATTSTEANDLKGRWIEVCNAETLANIGFHPDYPLDGHYRQTADIDASILSKSIGNQEKPFTGEYDGQFKTLKNLRQCLVKNLGKEGRISNLHIDGANIYTTKPAGAVACEVAGKVSHIMAENVYISTTGGGAHAGVGGGDVCGAVINVTAMNSTIKTSGGGAKAGVGAGVVTGTVANISALNCHVETSGAHALAGIGSGDVSGTLVNTTAVGCTAKTSGSSAEAAIGGGDAYGTISNTIAVNCKVETSVAKAGIGEGDDVTYKTVDRKTAAVNCMIQSEGGKWSLPREFQKWNHSKVCNTFVNGQRLNETADFCARSLNVLCKNSGHLLSPDCQPDRAFFKGLKSQQFYKPDACPVHAGNSPGIPQHWIEVNDTETLRKIGHHSNYPLNGRYRQTTNIDANSLNQSIGSNTLPFTGEYDGQCHTIDNLRHCLVKNLAGSITNLGFTGGNILANETAGVVACEVSTEGGVSNIRVENAYVSVLRDPPWYYWYGYYESGGSAGIGAGRVYGTVANLTALNCTVNSLPDSGGIGGGRVDGTVANTTAVNCTVSGKSSGVGGGYVSGMVANTWAVNCMVSGCNSGIGGGTVEGTVANTLAMNCKVEATCGAGIGGGDVGGTVTNTTAINCKVETTSLYGEVAAGIGGGTVGGTVINTKALNSMTSASGEDANSGIGAGEVSGTAANIMAVNCMASSTSGSVSGRGLRAGIGGGYVGGITANIMAINCTAQASRSRTSRTWGAAGIGAGVSSGTVTDTTAINCKVKTSGTRPYAGIGAGLLDHGTVANTKALNCKIEASGDAGIGAGGEFRGYRSGWRQLNIPIIANTTAVNCTVETLAGRAGIGVGGLTADSEVLAVDSTTAVHCKVETSNDHAEAGIGAGQIRGVVANTIAVNCEVRTSGSGSHAGIGVGDDTWGTFAHTTITNTTAINCKVITSGTEANAGIGIGFFYGNSNVNITNTAAVNCKIEASRADAAIAGGSKANICNTRVNGARHRDTGNGCSMLLDDLCKSSGHSLVTSDCQPNNRYLAAINKQIPDLDLLNLQNVSQFDYCPAPIPVVTQQVIEVTNAETLGNIGTDPNYPLNGIYIQTTDLDASTLSRPIRHFTGQYNGQHHTIANLGCCLVDTLEGSGSIGNLHFTGARINASGPSGVVACGVEGNGTLHDILVDNSQVMTTGHDADAGIGAGVLSGGTVVNTTAINSTVATAGEGADAGIGGGSIGNGAAVSHITALNSRVGTVGQHAHAAIGAGSVNGTVADTFAINSTVATTGAGANAGIAGGHVHGAVANTSARNSTVVTGGQGANAGIAGGTLASGSIANTTATHSQVTTAGTGAHAAIGGGSVFTNCAVTDTTAINSLIDTFGGSANGGIGGGEVNGTVASTSAKNSTVSTIGDGGNAGIGAGSLAGNGAVTDTTAVNSRVETTGNRANAGIGGGSIAHGASLVATTAQGSSVTTSGDGANAGIGAGRMGRSARVRDTSAQGSRVATSGADANAGIGVGVMDHRARIADTRSDNSKVETSGVRANAGIGAGAIRGKATVTDTRAVNSTATASGNDTSAGIGAGRIDSGGVVTHTTEVNSFARATGYSSGKAGEPLAVTTPAPVTETVATVADTTMTFSGLPGATMALPTSAAPLAATLSTGAIAGIALGAAAFVLAGVAGVCIYRHYHRRPSPADADDPQELVAINTAGQARKTVDQPMIVAVKEDAGEAPAVEQRSKIPPPKPPRLQKPTVPEKPPRRKKPALPEKPPATDPFFAELRDRVSPWHEHLYEDADRYHHPRRMRTAVAPDGSRRDSCDDKSGE